MPARVLISLALVIVAVAGERFAHYGQQMFLGLTLHQDGMLTAAEIGTVFAVTAVLRIIGTLVAGGLAFVVPPRLTALGGMILVAVALLGFAVAGSPRMQILAVYAGGFASGLVWPSIYAYAARVLTYEGETDASPPSGRRFLTFACFVMCLTAGIDVASACAPILCGALMSSAGARAASLLAASAAIAAAVVLGLTFAVHRDDKAPSDAAPKPTAYRTEPGAPSAQAPQNPAPILFALALSLPLALVSILQTASFFFDEGQDYRQRAFNQAAEVGASIVSALALVVVLIVLAQKRSSVSIALFVGGGLALSALGFFARLAHVAPTLAMGFEGLAFPLTGLAIVYPALATRGRGAALVIAGFTTVQTLGSFLGGAAASWATGATVVGATVLILAGVALTVLGRRTRALFEAS